MTKIANPGFTKKFDSCADMLAVAGPKVNFSTLAVGDCFISRDYFPRTGAVYFKMQKTGAASADVTVVFDKLKALPYSGGVDIPADMVVTACSPDFGNPLDQTEATSIMESKMIEYGHDKQGGFYAIDEAERITYYAYPSSPNADTAKSHVLAPRFVPGWVSGEIAYRNAHPEFDWEERFVRIAGEFRSKVSMPYWIPVAA